MVLYPSLEYETEDGIFAEEEAGDAFEPKLQENDAIPEPLEE